jgi:hypothetical protein
MKKLDPSVSPHHDLHALLHPAQAFAHPDDVVADADLTHNEKRAILAAWASDACAVEAAPALRRAPGAPAPVTVDSILEALRTLDAAASATSWARRQARRESIEEFRRRRASGGRSGHELSH